MDITFAQSSPPLKTFRSLIFFKFISMRYQIGLQCSHWFISRQEHRIIRASELLHDMSLNRKKNQ